LIVLLSPWFSVPARLFSEDATRGWQVYGRVVFTGKNCTAENRFKA